MPAEGGWWWRTSGCLGATSPRRGRTSALITHAAGAAIAWLCGYRLRARVRSLIARGKRTADAHPGFGRRLQDLALGNSVDVLGSDLLAGGHANANRRLGEIDDALQPQRTAASA